MTASQLGRRLGVTSQAVLDTEKRESTGDVTLTQLRKVADALECEVFYALVPRGTLAETVRERARKIATEEVEELSHSMALEDQQTDSAFKEKRVEAEIRRLLNEKKRSHLWR
jgi:predicted DNA-binding mobile mystery protein A